METSDSLSLTHLLKKGALEPLPSVFEGDYRISVGVI